MAIDADIIAFREMESVTGDDDSGEMAIADIGGIFFPELQSLFTENMDQKDQTLIPDAAVSIAIWNGTGMPGLSLRHLSSGRFNVISNHLCAGCWNN